MILFSSPCTRFSCYGADFWSPAREGMNSSRACRRATSATPSSQSPRLGLCEAAHRSFKLLRVQEEFTPPFWTAPMDGSDGPHALRRLAGEHQPSWPQRVPRGEQATAIARAELHSSCSSTGLQWSTARAVPVLLHIVPTTRCRDVSRASVRDPEVVGCVASTGSLVKLAHGTDVFATSRARVTLCLRAGEQRGAAE